MGGRRGREVNNGAEDIGSASRGSRGDEQLTILIAVLRAPMCATLGVMERSSHCQKQCATGAQTNARQLQDRAVLAESQSSAIQPQTPLCPSKGKPGERVATREASFPAVKRDVHAGCTRCATACRGVAIVNEERPNINLTHGAKQRARGLPQSPAKKRPIPTVPRVVIG